MCGLCACWLTHWLLMCRRRRIQLVTCQRYFSPVKSKRDLGYTPKVGMREAIQRTVAHFSHLSNPAVAAHSKAQ